MKEYIYAENINKTGETGIVNTKTIKVLCLCPKENADIILKALERSETPIHDRWAFIASNDLPTEDGKYYCLNKYGEQGWCLWGNSGAPNENTYFFDTKDGIQAKDIVCWMKL